MKAASSGSANATPVLRNNKSHLQAPPKSRPSLNPLGAGGKFNVLKNLYIIEARLLFFEVLLYVCRRRRIYSDSLIEQWSVALNAYIMQRAVAAQKHGIEPEVTAIQTAIDIHSFIRSAMRNNSLLFRPSAKTILKTPAKGA